MKKMRVAQVPAPKQPFQIVERAVPEPGPGEVRVKVEACGICHSDMYTADGLLPGHRVPARARARGGRAWSTPSGAGVAGDGRPAIASGSAGTAGTAGTATPAGAETS